MRAAILWPPTTAPVSSRNRLHRAVQQQFDAKRFERAGGRRRQRLRGGRQHARADWISGTRARAGSIVRNSRFMPVTGELRDRAGELDARGAAADHGKVISSAAQVGSFVPLRPARRPGGGGAGYPVASSIFFSPGALGSARHGRRNRRDGPRWRGRDSHAGPPARQSARPGSSHPRR